jgi:hypothetical protein
MQKVMSALVVAGTVLAGLHPASAQSLRWLTQTQKQNAQYPIEVETIGALEAAGFDVSRNEFQVLGLNLADALRLVGSGAFNLATVQVGSVARDDPFLEAST